MEKQTFKITIDASRAKVWEILWGDDTYPEWTSVFAPGSNVKTDWNEGSKVLFGDGEGNGMVSRIARKIVNEVMSFEHLGEMHNGVEDLDSEKVNSWSGAMENYYLRDVEGKTELSVDIDVTDDFKDYFATAWPKAMAKLKSMAEKNRAAVPH